MIDIFKSLVSEGLFIESKLNSVRVKVHTPCQWSCAFCHMEGNKNSEAIRDVSELMNVLGLFRDRLGFSEVHFTGGEATIHPLIVNMMKQVTDAGFTAKMTTNGQTEIDQYKKLIDAGLSELNMSVHTLDPIRMGQVMFPVKNSAWGKKAVQRQSKLIQKLSGRIQIKINTCVDDDEFDALSIVEMAKEYGIK